MPEFNFTLVIRGLADINFDMVDDLIEAGCDDASFGVTAGVAFGEFDREAPNAWIALHSAAEQIESVNQLKVHHAEPTEFVSLSQIAERTGRTGESVRQLAVGSRGPGGFPVPVGGVMDRTRLWRWSDVVEWWMDAFPGELSEAAVDLARAVERFNLERQLGIEALAVGRTLGELTSERERIYRICSELSPRHRDARHLERYVWPELQEEELSLAGSLVFLSVADFVHSHHEAWKALDDTLHDRTDIRDACLLWTREFLDFFEAAEFQPQRKERDEQASS